MVYSSVIFREMQKIQEIYERQIPRVISKMKLRELRFLPPFLTSFLY